MVQRVFLVEDLCRMEALMRDLFELIGGFCVAGTAATEAEAILWLDEHRGGWDLAVVDLVLDQGSGIGVVARCRARKPDGKVVVFSSYASPAIRRHCREVGADAVFDKSEHAAFIEYCAELSGTQPA